VYSGDTRPSRALQQCGSGATLLIHEATFEHELIQQALLKRHSTTTEALECGQAMGAYRTVLTHFSQRYPRLPAGVDVQARPWRRRSVLAFDGMWLPFACLPHLPAVMPAVAVALEELQQVGEEADEAEQLE
jgi:ribonuclease Z